MSKEELLDRLDEAETMEEIRGIGEELLALDSECPYGKLAVWEAMEHDDAVENLDMLREALDTIRAVVEAKDVPAVIDEDRDATVYCTIMMNYGYSLLSEERLEEALEVAKELANFDDEGAFQSRQLLYRVMLDLGMYNEILDELDKDTVESVVGEHARAIALVETGADAGEIRDAVNNAIALSPDVPFFVVQIWEFPDEDEDVDDDMLEVLDDAGILADPWCKTDERLAAISAPTFLFGYLTDRLTDEKEIKVLRAAYKEAGVAEKIEKLKKEYKKLENNGTDPEEIDAMALGETMAIFDEIESENK